ncbi:FxDxF family PEP-CTERM protein [Paucibacter sp. hw8]|uniref:FxDxF family PEP-CTERM protein n=1 Tax=Roseateles albus TaxID=2987525 RepID=A0ABT5KKY1_9BURK|nr:FxDxF family PEP-CTERM protein [Roseateles albus]MDC8774169.1 FxDxF family PEP-CTERM protein [Roseateles albus]
MSKLNFIAAAVLALSSVAANATTIYAPSISGTSFTDVVVGQITVASLSDIVGNFFAAESVTFPAPFAGTYTLDKVTFTSSSVGSLVDLDASAVGFKFQNVAAGVYTVKASGTLDLSGEFKKAAFIGAEYNVTAVPEPTTYALLLAGLGAVGFVARRRKAA